MRIDPPTRRPERRENEVKHRSSSPISRGGERIEYYSAMRKKEILPFTTFGIDLESIMLNPMLRHKPDKDKYCIVSFICGI